MIQPSTIASELADELLPFLGSGLKYPADDKNLLILEAKAKQLSKANSRVGYVFLAACSMLKGNFEEMRSRFKIAENQGLEPGSKLNHGITLSHAGFFIEASDLIANAALAMPDPIFAAHKAMSCAQFKLAYDLYNKASKMKLLASEDSDFHAIPGIYAVAKEALVDDTQAAKQADLAGEVMRDNNVYHKGEVDITSCPKDFDDLELIVATFRVPVSYEKASDMNFSYAEKVISKGWEKSNFIIRFCGDTA